MYRILIILSSIVLLATSCQKETSIDSPATLTYTVVPEVTFEVKSGEEGAIINSEVNILSYLVYHKKENGEFVYVGEMGDFVEISGTSNINVPITLIKDQTYKLVFIAQHRFESNQRTDCYAYTYNNTDGTMALNPSAPFTNGDQLEAYVFVEEVSVKGNDSRSATLRRIVSQINIGTSAATYPENLNIAVTGAAASYNVFSGAYTQATNPEESTLSLSNIETPAAGTDPIKVSNTDYNRLATLYCLGSNKLALTMTNTDDDQNNFTINNVSTQVNYKTNIVGNILAGTYTVQASDLDTFTSALANPKVTHIELTAPIYELTAPIYINRDITIDGRGAIVTQASTWNEADATSIIKIDNSNVTLKNINFKNTIGKLIETIDSDLHAENITVQGHNSVVTMIILRGFGSFTNCTFTQNTCGGNGLLYYASGDDDTKGLTLQGNTFSNNTITTNQENVATVYLANRGKCLITNNRIQNNTVNTTAATPGIVSGGLTINYDAIVTNNIITDNKLGDIVSNIYLDKTHSSIDLSTNTINP